MAHSAEYNRRRREAYAASKAEGLSASEARQSRHEPSVFNHPGNPLSNFQNWSKKDVGFPSDIQGWIGRNNRRAGRHPVHSFGYRLFYHIYVDKLSDSRAIHASEGQKT